MIIRALKNKGNLQEVDLSIVVSRFVIFHLEFKYSKKANKTKTKRKKQQQKKTKAKQT